MPSECHFEFDRGNPIYYSGETIKTRITLTIASEKTCREVYIEFKGEAKVNWSEKRNRRSGPCSGQETYISNHTTLHPECKLQPGTYTYNFDITLPTESPSSCVTKYGHINYEISLVIDRPFRFDNVFRRPLTVLNNFNLNLLPELLIPLQGEDTKYICCWPCKSDPIISTLTIAYGGYAPGQSIKYALHIDNQSSGYDLIGTRLRLVQTYTFIATNSGGRPITVTAKIAEINQNETVLRLTKRILEGSLYIPPTPPSSQTEGIITVKYHIEMAIKTGYGHKDSKIVIPIKLGTVPLFQTVMNSDQISHIQPTAPTTDTSFNQPPTYDNLKPPYYQQTSSETDHFVDTDIDARHRIDGFLPQYPMYNNFILPVTP